HRLRSQGRRHQGKLSKWGASLLVSNSSWQWWRERSARLGSKSPPCLASLGHKGGCRQEKAAPPYFFVSRPSGGGGSAARGRLARALNTSKGTPVARALGVAPGVPSFSPRSREWSRRAGRGPISARGACGRRAPSCASPSARRRPCVG